MFKKIAAPSKHQGFTLVEVLTVMLVLVAIASVTVEVGSDLAFQNRYEVTKDRYEKIKRAIIGRPDVLINGQPDISGFVADMGRLPDNLRELFQAGYCVSTVGSAPANLTTDWRPSTCTGDWLWSNTPCSDNTSTTEATCTTAGHRWMGTQISTGIKLGWNGPYLSSKYPASDFRALGDSWANLSTDDNYGWIFTPVTNLGDLLSIKSKGKDQIVNAGGCLDYDDDCEFQILPNDYSKGILTMTVFIN